MFSRVKDCPTTHKSLMKGVTDNDCVQAMIGDVKVSVAGLAQATQVRCRCRERAKGSGGWGGGVVMVCMPELLYY